MPLGQGCCSSRCLLRRWRRSLQHWHCCSASGLLPTYSASGLVVTPSSLIAVSWPACMQVRAYRKYRSVVNTAIHTHIWPLLCYVELIRCLGLQALFIVGTGSRPSSACGGSFRPGSDDRAYGRGRGRVRQGNLSCVEGGEGGRGDPSPFSRSPVSRALSHARMLPTTSTYKYLFNI